MKKRILSLFLAVVMVVLAIPAVILPTFATSVSNANGLYKTSLSFSEDIYDNVVANKDKSVITLPKKNWEVGVMLPDSWNNGYTAAVNHTDAGVKYAYVCAGGGNWMNAALAGGYYYASGQTGLVFTSEYDSTKHSTDPNWTGALPSADYRTWKANTSNVLVRYTAEYAGTVTIDVSKLLFKHAWNCVFAILVDGKPVGQFNTADFDYATGKGWYDPSVTTDVASDITKITNVSVNKGSTIDFIFRGVDNMDKASIAEFTYATCRHATSSFEFDVTYTDVSGLTSDAVVESVYDVNDWGKWYRNKDTVGGNDPIEQAGPFVLGYLPVTYDFLTAMNAGVGIDYSIANFDKLVSVGNTFTKYINNHRDANSYQNFYGANNAGHNGATSGAAGGFLQDGSSEKYLQYCPGVYYGSGSPMVVYNETTGKYELSSTKYSGGNEALGYTRYMNAFPSVASLRYVAEYGGNVTIDLTGRWNSVHTKDMAHLFVYVNGVRVKTYTSDGSTADKQLSIVNLEDLEPGDTVDIVNVVDPRFGILMVTPTLDKADGSGTVANPWYNADYAAANAKWGGMDLARRSFQIKSVKVTVTDPVYGATNTWDGGGAIVANKINYDNINLFQWYTDANATTEIAKGGALASGNVAKISKAMIDAAGLDWDTLTADELLDAYVNYLVSKGNIAYKDPVWAHGGADVSGKFSALAYYAPFHDISITLAKGGKVVSPTLSQLISKDGLADMVNTGWGAVADSVLDSTTGEKYTSTSLVKNLILNYSSGVETVATYAHSVIGCRSETNFNILRPQANFAGNKGSAAFVYTAQSDGVVSVNFRSFKLTEKAAFQWRISVNGEFISPVAEYTCAAVGYMTADELAGFNAQVKAVLDGMKVNAGDTIGFHFARNAAGNGVCLTPQIDITLFGAEVEVDNSVNLVITDAYAVKMEATPSVKNGKVDVLVDGNVVTTLDSTTGYAYALKSGIKVNDLTCTTSTTAEWVEEGDVDGETVSYQLREERGAYTVTSKTYTTNTNEMLKYYESGAAGEKAAALATEIRHLAIAVDAALANREAAAGGDITTAEKYHLRGQEGDVFLTDVALTELAANKPAYGHVGNVEDYDYVIAGANVNYGDKISIVLLLDATADADIWALKEGYKLVAYEGESKITEATEFAGVAVKGKDYVGVIVDVPVSKYNTSFEFALETAEGEAAARLQYSVSAWMANKYVDDAAWNTYVIRGVYNLGVAAAAYNA